MLYDIIKDWPNWLVITTAIYLFISIVMGLALALILGMLSTQDVSPHSYLECGCEPESTPIDLGTVITLLLLVLVSPLYTWLIILALVCFILYYAIRYTLASNSTINKLKEDGNR